jgi:cytochrome c553
VKNLPALLLMATLSPGVSLAEAPAWNEIKGELKTALGTKGDPVRGQALFEPCTGCHRADASGRTSGAYPRLSGQHQSVLIKQIADIRSGKRSNPKMELFADEHVLNAYEIADIAVYLNALPIHATNGKGPGKAVARGEEIYSGNCVKCHGDEGEGDAEKFYPMVAAQHFKYLLRELKMIRDGDRKNANPEMVKVVKAYNDHDLEAVADYMSNFGPPKKPEAAAPEAPEVPETPAAPPATP